MKKKEFTIHQGKQSLVDKLMDARQKMIDEVKIKNHRLEVIRSVDGVEYVNDSSATSISHSKDSIRCIKDPIIWIMEGTDFDRDFILLNKIAKYKIESIVAYGADTEDAKRDLKSSVDNFVQVDNLFDAVNEARALAKEGYVVLFSPTCPVKSYYANYAERGIDFKEMVEKLGSDLNSF